jgi:hypothetical protein
MLTASHVEVFLQDLSTHLKRMVYGESGLRFAWPRALGYLAAGLAATAAAGAFIGARDRRAPVRQAAFFLVVWIGLAVAPTIVAGYASPRHMYLASMGWALALGCALDVFWHARPDPYVRRIGMAAAAAVLFLYGRQLYHEVRLWDVRADVSRAIVRDIEREALASPPGTLIIAGAPRRSWDFAVPHALRPPFTREDLTARVRVVSHSSIHCCPAVVWEPYTRTHLAQWAADPATPPVIALHWDQETGRLSRLSDRDDPFLRSLVTLLRQTPDVPSLDRVMLDVTNRFTAGRGR